MRSEGHQNTGMLEYAIQYCHMHGNLFWIIVRRVKSKRECISLFVTHRHSLLLCSLSAQYCQAKVVVFVANRRVLFPYWLSSRRLCACNQPQHHLQRCLASRYQLNQRCENAQPSGEKKSLRKPIWTQFD